MGRWLFALLVVFPALVVGTLFAVQNASRTTQLSLNLGFFAAELTQPVSLPLLMAVCVGTGFVVGWLVAAIRGALRRRRQQDADLT